MDIRSYIDSTYLKTFSQSGLNEERNQEVVATLVEEAIRESFKLVMIRPEMVSLAKQMIVNAASNVKVGTVIDFPEGNATIEVKLKEAAQAIADGADELDFVCNYEAFKNGAVDLVKGEILRGTQLALTNHKIIKWIIEVAALTDKQIIQLSALIKNVVMAHFKEADYSAVFVKSSTGFYKMPNNEPNGATKEAIIMMLENASPLPVKAAGGVRTYEEAEAMIKLGVKRIGTSSALAIVNGGKVQKGY
ncbi:deoxyribose-phosphate aldolase [Flavobacterium daejeonense]|uniref:deoxyribose-phosphate aldolase n=1 Tax=Flavobacterium daejeonense TaxID=350893 RepID=UPI000479DB74|nr:deoxyribose-phosphate aldolase [Flavobacterium daejeonense]